MRDHALTAPPWWVTYRSYYRWWGLGPGRWIVCRVVFVLADYLAERFSNERPYRWRLHPVGWAEGRCEVKV